MEDSQRCTAEYEKPRITRHAVVMTMAPMGSKLGHGIFPFRTKLAEGKAEEIREVHEQPAKEV